MIYLDYASTTPLNKIVMKEMKKYFNNIFANPSSLHFLGQKSLKVVDESREKIKEIINAEFPNEIIFTSSATESNNLAIKGLAFLYFFRFKIKPHIISSKIEHPSILEPLKDLKNLDLIDYDLVDVDKFGVVNIDDILKKIRENTLLISIHYVNSEIGTIQPIYKISEAIKIINEKRKDFKIIFHTDASQAPLTEEIDVKKLGVDMMTISSHKIYGPKGIACLFKKNNILIERLISGSNQEFSIRPSTEAVPLIVGFSKALEIVTRQRKIFRKKADSLRRYFVKKLKENKINFEINSELKLTSPKILNIFFPQKTSQEILIYLDSKKIYVSSGMACKSRSNQPSEVLSILYPNSERPFKSIRFSFGYETKKEDLAKVVNYLKKFLH
jgi:cysteine desulfurase